MINDEQIREAEADGAKAALLDKEVGEACPYFFYRFPGITIAEFNSEKRPLMDAWFRGVRAGIDAKKKATP